MRPTLWMALWAALLCLGLVGCGEVQTTIHETSEVWDTDDNQGPYQVFATVESDLKPLKVSLVYTTDGWKTRKTLTMESISTDVYRAQLPGQKAGTRIEYFVMAEDGDSNKITDPKEAVNYLQGVNKGLTYRFQVLR